MKERINFLEKGPGALKALYAINEHLAKSTIGQSLLDLVYFRVSQINGCAFSLTMHSKNLRVKVETKQRLYTMAAWREAPFYSEKESAALVWAEAVTACNVSEDIYDETRVHFSEEELVDLTLAVTTINTYNRFNIAFRPTVGTYQDGQFDEQTEHQLNNQ